MYLAVYNELLANCIREHDAHKVAYGKKIEAFEAVRASFITRIPCGSFFTHEMPSTKSVRDRYHRLEKKRRKAVSDNELLSGNVETVADLDAV